MILNEAELRIGLGLTTTITDLERGLLALAMPAAQNSVTALLGYDPEQRVRTEYYPRPTGSRIVGGRWSVNSSRTRATYRRYQAGRGGETLQVAHLPIRAVSSIKEDMDGRFGDGDGAFGAGTELVQGTDYWVEWDEQYFCKSGLIYNSGYWSQEPGSLKVVYRSGYSTAEFNGAAITTTTSDESSEYTTTGVDASGIKQAILMTAMRSFHAIYSLKKNDNTGFVPGPIKSEKMQDYSYTLGDDAAAAVSMMTSVPPQAREMLEPFMSYGRWRT